MIFPTCGIEISTTARGIGTKACYPTTARGEILMCFGWRKLLSAVVLGFVWEWAIVMNASAETKTEAPVTKKSSSVKITSAKWHGSKAGISDKVLPPWTAIETTGKSVKCWGREYSFDDFPLPARIVSQGKGVLAGPIITRANQRRTIWKKGNFKIVSASSSKVCFASSVENEEGLTVSGKGIIEYDGFFWIRLSLTPPPDRQIKNLSIEIPVKDASIFNIPARGESHPWRVYSSGKIPSAGWRGDFKPCIWMGNYKRGLTWFAETDQQWLNDGNNKIEITKNGNKTVLKLNIINTTNWDKPVEIAFGLQATPLRPYPKNRYNSRFNVFYVGYPYEGKEANLNTHLDFRQTIAENKKAGVETLAAIWQFAFYGYIPHKIIDKKTFTQTIDYFHNKKAKVLLYVAPGLSPVTDEYKRFGKKWVNIPTYRWPSKGSKHNKALQKRADLAHAGICPRGDFSDFLCNSIETLLKNHPLDGLYWDSIVPASRPCFNKDHGCGYKTKNGKSRPTYPILAHRELARRIYTMIKARNGIFVVHTSSCIVPPVLAFADVYLTGEQLNYDKTPLHPTLYEYQAEFNGCVWGIPCELLIPDGVIKRGDTLTVQKFFTWGLLHGDRPGGFNDWDKGSGPGEIERKTIPAIYKALNDFGLVEAEWIPYFEAKDYVKISTSKVKASLYLKKSEALIIVGNMKAEEIKDISYRLNLKKLGMSEQSLSIRDALSGKNLPLNGTTFSLTLPAYGNRMLLLKSK